MLMKSTPGLTSLDSRGPIYLLYLFAINSQHDAISRLWLANHDQKVVGKYFFKTSYSNCVKVHSLSNSEIPGHFFAP